MLARTYEGGEDAIGTGIPHLEGRMEAGEEEFRPPLDGYRLTKGAMGRRGNIVKCKRCKGQFWNLRWGLRACPKTFPPKILDSGTEPSHAAGGREGVGGWAKIRPRDSICMPRIDP